MAQDKQQQPKSSSSSSTTTTTGSSDLRKLHRVPGLSEKSLEEAEPFCSSSSSSSFAQAHRQVRPRQGLFWDLVRVAILAASLVLVLTCPGSAFQLKQLPWSVNKSAPAVSDHQKKPVLLPRIAVHFSSRRQKGADDVPTTDQTLAANSYANSYANVQVPNYDGVATLFFSQESQDQASAAQEQKEDKSAWHYLTIEDTRAIERSMARLVWITKEVVDASSVDAYLTASAAAGGDADLSVQESREVVSTRSLEACLEQQNKRPADRMRQAWSPYVSAVFDDIEALLPGCGYWDSADVKTLMSFPHSALLLVPVLHLPSLDKRLSRFVRPYTIDFAESDSAPPAKSNATFPAARLDAHVSTLLRSPLIANESRIIADLEVLSGESKSKSQAASWETRHSSTYGGLQAAHWLLEQQRQAVESKIPGARCDLWEYSRGNLNPNVLCIVPGSAGVLREDQDNEHHEEGAIILSAHYDSRGSFGNPRAPGADDDGSGTAMLLAVSRVLGEAIGKDVSSTSSSGETERRRRRPLHLAFFSGEEQGLLGSQAYAAHLRRSNDSARYEGGVKLSDVRLAVQTDMVAYRRSGEARSIAVPDRLATESASTFLLETARLYSPQLVRGETPACCSDHQSFWEQGFPATQLFERPGPIADPRYHDSADLVNREGYDVGQLRLIGNVVIAAAAQLLWE